MKKYFLSFADSRLHRSLDRILHQANKMAFFDECYGLNEKNLPKKFISQFKDQLIPGSRGYGYWSWKPEIIKEIIDKIDVGDGLIYVDAGCHLNLHGRNRLKEYFDILETTESGIVAFQANKPSPENSTLIYDGRKLFDQPNYQWIKGDLFDYFRARGKKEYTHSQAIGAGIFLIRKCNKSLKIIDEWRQIIRNDFKLIDDTPSVSKNFDGFIEHRHDQAIFTLLCIKYKVKTLCSYELWMPKKFSLTSRFKPDWKILKNFPIHAKRDRDFGFKENFKINFFFYTRKFQRVIKILSAYLK